MIMIVKSDLWYFMTQKGTIFVRKVKYNPFLIFPLRFPGPNKIVQIFLVVLKQEKCLKIFEKDIFLARKVRKNAISTKR